MKRYEQATGHLRRIGRTRRITIIVEHHGLLNAGKTPAGKQRVLQALLGKLLLERIQQDIGSFISRQAGKTRFPTKTIGIVLAKLDVSRLRTLPIDELRNGNPLNRLPTQLDQALRRCPFRSRDGD